MASLSKTLDISHPAQQLRPFDARRDLEAVADLIELGFAETLDEEGQRYLKQMRATAKSYRDLGLFGMAGRLTTFSMSGYVWEEEGRVVGNLSLIPYLMGTRRSFLIANVVVHPDHRRRGIGQALTQRGIEHARKAAAPSAWLHVREENAGAIKLYESLGFTERARRTSWYASGEAPRQEANSDITIAARQKRYWTVQRKWLEVNYPRELNWNPALNLNSLRPGLVGSLSRFISNLEIAQWEITRSGELCAVACWQAGFGRNHTLWLAAPPQADDEAVESLLLYARRNIPATRPLALDYPARQSEQAIQAAGFYDHQTLIWMENRL